MHNNGPVNLSRASQKEFYTVIEASVQWARSEGVKSANDPRITHYTQLLIEAVKKGTLRTYNPEPSSTLSNIPAIASVNLKQWMEIHFPESRPAFLFGSDKSNKGIKQKKGAY